MNNVKITNDPVLDQYTQGYLPEDGAFIFPKLVPSVIVGSDTGQIKRLSTDPLRVVSSETELIVDRSGTPEVSFKMDKVDAWRLETSGLKTLVTKKDGYQFNKLNWASGYQQAKNMYGMFLKKLKYTIKELEIANVLKDTSIIPYTDVSLNAQDQWSDSTSDVLGMVKDARTAVYTATGYEANIGVMSREVFEEVCIHPQILAKLGTANVDALTNGVTEDQLAKIFKLEKIYIGRARYESGAQGLTSAMVPVWGKHFTVLHVNQSPLTLMFDFSFGIEFVGGPLVADTFKIDDPKNAEFVRIEEERDLVVLKASAAFTYLNVVA